MGLLPVVVVVLGILIWRRGRGAPPDALRTAGFWLLAISAGFFMLFVVGETVDDPGGVAAIGLIALWAIPVVALVALVLRAPARATNVLVGVTAAVVAMDVVTAIVGDQVRDWEDEHGPVRAIVTLALCLPLAFLGRERTMVAGLCLLALGVVPALLSATSTFAPGGAVAVLSSPPLASGLLYVASELLRNQPTRSSISHA